MTEELFRNTHEINYSNMILSQELVAEIAEFSELRSLDLSETNIADDQLDVLLSLHSLEILILSDTDITSEFARWLKNLVNLKTLFLRDTKIDEHAFYMIGRLPSLKCLDVLGTNIKSLKGIEGAGQLEDLRVAGTQIDDFSIEYILQLKKLTHLYVSDTKISPKGVEWLRQHSSANIFCELVQPPNEGTSPSL